MEAYAYRHASPQQYLEGIRDLYDRLKATLLYIQSHPRDFIADDTDERPPTAPLPAVARPSPWSCLAPNPPPISCPTQVHHYGWQTMLHPLGNALSRSRFGHWVSSPIFFSAQGVFPGDSPRRC